MGTTLDTGSIQQQITTDFPPAARPTVERLLASYGQRPNEREPERVRRAILQLARGDLGEVQRLVRAARWQYRDVLYWALLEA